MFIGITLSNHKYLFEKIQDVENVMFPAVTDPEFYLNGELREEFYDLPSYENKDEPVRKEGAPARRGKPPKS